VRVYRLTPRALEDLDAIADYTQEKWGSGQMAAYLTELHNRFQWLADNPNLGRDRGNVQSGYRSFKQGMHLVFYTVRGNEIQIIGVPHVSMDIDAYYE